MWKKIKRRRKCGCTAEKETKKTTSSANGFDFAKTMTAIKDDLLASVKNPIDVIKDNVDENDMPKTYVLAAIIALSFGLFFAGIFKNVFGLILGAALDGMGSLVSTSKLMDSIKIPYVKVVIYGFIIYAISLVAYAVVMLIVPAIFKNKKLDFKKAMTLTAAAFIPMIFVNVACALIGFLNIDIRVLLIVYVLGALVVGYNFAYAYAKITGVEDNKFGYTLAVLVALAALISGVCTYFLGNAMGNSIANDIAETSVEDLLD